MKAKDLSRILMRTPESEVQAYDAEVERYVAVTGCVYSPPAPYEPECLGVVEICTDDAD